MKYRLVKSELIDSVIDEYKVTLLEIPGWFDKLLGYEKQEVQYVGSCSVWHRMPDFQRASLGLESILSEFWTKLQYQRKYEKAGK